MRRLTSYLTTLVALFSLPVLSLQVSAAITAPGAEKGVTWKWFVWKLPGGKYDWEGVEQDAQMIQDAGITWARSQFDQSQSFSDIDHVILIAKKHGIHFIFTAIKNPQQIGTPEQEAAGQAWLAEAAERYKTSVDVWEIHNEPNDKDSWPSYASNGESGRQQAVHDYIQYLAQSYRTIKSRAPTAFVMMGGVSDWKAEAFFDLFRQGGGGQYTDAVVIHPYADTPNEAASRLVALTHYAQRDPWLKNKPIWITEVGFQNEPTWSLPGYVSSEQQKAQDLVEVMRDLRAAGVTTPICWYDFHEENPDRRGYGLVTFHLPHSVTPLPAYAAYQNYYYSP